MGSTREQIVETVCVLLESQGYHATGLKQILSESGSPKGSLYYYFPQGKEELAEAAVMRSASIVASRIRSGLAAHEDLAKAVQTFVRGIADAVERSNFSAGGPLTTIALETVHSSQRLNLACRQAYSMLEEAFAEKIAASGFQKEQSLELATFIVASLEGAILLSRTNHSGDALRQIADSLRLFLEMLPRAGGPLEEKKTELERKKEIS